MKTYNFKHTILSEYCNFIISSYVTILLNASLNPFIYLILVREKIIPRRMPSTFQQAASFQKSDSRNKMNVTEYQRARSINKILE